MLESKENNVDENQWKLLNFVHTKIGSRKFHSTPTQSLSEFRVALQMTTQLFLFTNYDFEYKGNKLSDFMYIGDIIPQKQAEIQIVIKVFDYRSAKHHLSKVMQVLNDPELYLYLFSSNQRTGDQNSKQPESHKLPIFKFVQEFNIQQMKPELGCKLLNNSSQSLDKVEFLYSISLSGFNPPPTSQRLNGDLFYVHARSLEGQDLHITACPYGFYLNQSKISNFNPNKSTSHKGVYANLIDLLKEVSEKFRYNLEEFSANSTITDAMKYKFQSIDKIRKRKWLENLEQQHGWNSKKNFVDTHIKVDLLSLKDWNQSFQIEHHLSQQNKISAEQKLAQLQKIYTEFQSAAIQGAVFLVDGKISPLNPTDDKKKHIYIYNKIFFSIANQTPYDHSQEKGQDATPSSSAINTDLKNIQVLQSLGISQLHILHTMIVSYRGFKIIAQCIIPGILSVDQLNCSQYGSIDDGKTVENNPQFEKIMVEVCQKLHIEDKIMVEDQNGVKKRIAGSPDVKGILGSDKRKYILDLLRLSPRDLNYQGPKNQTCVIRRQLLKKYFDGKDHSTIPKLNTNIGTDIKFDPNQQFVQQEKLLKDIAQYLRKTAIPSLINTFKNSPSQYLTDNSGATKAFHMWGVNMRYLGEVCSHQQIKYEPQIKIFLERMILIRTLKQFLRMVMRQSSIMHLGATIVHALNCIFSKKNHLTIMEQGIISEGTNEQNNDKQSKKKKKKKTKDTTQSYQENGKDFCQIINVIKVSQNKYITMKPSEMWAQVCLIAKARYNYQLPQNIQKFEVFKFPFQKIATLRDLCLIVGIVLQKKNYDLFENINHQSDKTPPFSIRNIISLEPRPKHMEICPINLQERERQSEKFIEKYQVKEALKLDTILEKQNILISGGLNQTAIRLYTRMSRILYILGDNKAAIAQQQKNVSMLEAICPQDDSLIIQSHLNLGLYYIGIGDKQRVIYHMKKSLFLMLIAFGQTSPDLLICLANLARIYQMNKQYQQVIKCYDVAIYYINKIHGKYHVKMSFCYTSLASVSYEMGNLKKAIDYQTQNVGILCQIFAQSDSRLQDGIKILKMYREMIQKAQIQQNVPLMGNQTVSKPSENKKGEQEKGKKKVGKK